VLQSLNKYVEGEPIALLSAHDELDDLLQLDTKYVDLIIPRGSNQLARYVKEKSKSIPVLGHAVEACSVYIDKECDREAAIKIGNLIKNIIIVAKLIYQK
jgi:gamma-glutamyl phosphate reductase